MKNKLIKIALFSSSMLIYSLPTYASYWLVIGTYRQGPSARPEVSGITSPSLYALPMKDLKSCEEAGLKITEKIYKPVWQFDSKWTCIYGGIDK